MRMKKIKVADATNAQLDWMVAQCQELALSQPELGILRHQYGYGKYHPTTDWSQGGPIIKRGHPKYPENKMEFRQGNAGIYASYWRGDTWFGPTHLIAAMRCYVVSMLGDEVEVPAELDGNVSS